MEPVAGSLVPRESQALRYLVNGVEDGRPWHRTLLEAMSMWTAPEERWKGRQYRYVIQDEAFDWLLLAERMCVSLRGLVPEDEVADLLIKGRFPQPVTDAELKDVLGNNKYRGLLNYWYGVVVEEAILLVVEDEVRKDMRSGGRVDVEEISNQAYRRIYDDDHASLLSKFREKMGYESKDSFTLTQAKEFTYWLFKLRLYYWDPARVASDTRKGLRRLEQLRGSSAPV